MAIKAVFLDLDGTISDAKAIAYDSMVLALEDFCYDFDEKLLRELMGIKMHLILEKLELKVDDLQVVRKRFYRYFIKAVDEVGIKPCVSLKPLWELKKEGMPLIIVSNSNSRFLKVSMKKLGIRKLFKGTYGSDSFNTKDEMLGKLFKKMKIHPSEAMYVGDRFSDIEYARDVGCVAVAIHNKCAWSPLKLIKKEKPDYIIRDFRGLKKIIKELE